MSAKDKQPVPGEILLTESEIADIVTRLGREISAPFLR